MQRRRDYAKKEILNRPVYQPKNPIFKPGKPEVVDPDINPNILEKVLSGASNVDLMKNGKAPIGIDGQQVNLHHLFGTEPGPMVAMLKSVHQNNHKVLLDFIEDSFRNDESLKKAYTNFREKYWKNRSKGF